MTEKHAADPLGSPDETRGGPDVVSAVANAESGSRAEGDHTPIDQDEPGNSRLEQMREVDTSGHREGSEAGPGTPPKPGPSPADIGSGGAQRLEGARTSDRVAAGEPVPDGPPFEPTSGDE